tara:strand:+ start:679 stop:1728 length:1050 start_codon:yes stop_codon:yes gene_type:complete
MSMILHGTVSDNTVALDRKTATPLIINGDMQIAQRGTSFTVGTADPYVTDRWKCVGDGASVFTVTQDTDVPTGQGFFKSLKWDTTTAESSLASGTAVLFMQRIEGQNLQMFKKGTSNAEAFTVSFWVKSAKTGVHILQMRDNNNSRQQSQSYTVASANTWEKHVVSFVADTTGAFDNDNGASLDLMWWLSAGSNFTSGTLATSWESVTNANRAVGQVNVADNTANNWYITGVQLEVGTYDANSIPAFQFEDRTTSLARCQRYFIKQEVGGGATADDDYSVNAFGAQFPTTMRANPTVTITNSSFSGHHGNNPTGTFQLSTQGAGLYWDGSNYRSSGSRVFVTYEADSEL